MKDSITKKWRAEGNLLCEWKRRIAVMLAVVLVLPGLLAALPTAALEVQAAETTTMELNLFVWSGGSKYNVENQQTFNIGDHIRVNQPGKISTVASLVSASYSSDNEAVAIVDTKGWVKTLSEGEATITIRYNGAEVKFEMNVVPEGEFAYKSGVSSMKDAAEKLNKCIPSTGVINVNSGFALLKQSQAYYKTLKVYEENYSIARTGLAMKQVPILDYMSWVTTNDFLVPQMGRWNCSEAILNDYNYKNSPTGTKSARCVKIKSVSASAKTNTIKIKIKKKITEEQLLAAEIDTVEYRDANIKLSRAKAEIYVSVTDMSNNYWYSGVGTIRKGSDVIELKLKDEYKRTIKLKKNKVYKIGSSKKQDLYAYWARGKKVKVK